MTAHWKLIEDRLRARIARSIYESGLLAAWFLLCGLMLILLGGTRS